MSYLRKRRFRQGVGIGLDELKSDRAKQKQLVTDLLMNRGYVGYFDIEDERIRIYIFSDKESAGLFLRESRKIGFRTAGAIDEMVHISNSELSRPHLKHYKGKRNFYSELYK